MSAASAKNLFIALGAIGTALTVFSFFIPGMENGKLDNQLVTQTVMSQDNQQKWANVPGDINYQLYWNHYLYNATNAYDVVFSNAMPQFTQQGPYVYQEYDTYFNDWNSDGSNVTSKLLQNTKFVSDPTSTIDTPMWLANQGAIQYWWHMSNEKAWRTYMEVLYTLVN
jgi:hypothetical protein